MAREIHTDNFILIPAALLMAFGLSAADIEEEIYRQTGDYAGRLRWSA